ncbi:hypothetical protein PIB30_072157 [Stylosanthes scabra]|uniref:Uncharacterized protein n=1 Tax=Stylosanthes scabra TaxID=79078 RepID=A0ABU6TNR8_9FABA|nr:hypothetical protein [Stylosanthes scabra]
MALGRTPPSAYMPAQYDTGSEAAPAPAVHSPSTDVGADAPPSRGRRVPRRRGCDAITSSGASLVTILPRVANLSAKTTSLGLVRIYDIHVRPDPHGPRSSCPCPPHAEVLNNRWASIQWPITLWDRE